MTTWRDYAYLLTPEQIAHFERCYANPFHPNGPDEHRVALIVMARDIFGAVGPWEVELITAPEGRHFPPPPGFYWGPLEKPENSLPNMIGTEPQDPKDGLKRWQEALGIPGTGSVRRTLITRASSESC
jgi:hypothetical protein